MTTGSAKCLRLVVILSTTLAIFLNKKKTALYFTDIRVVLLAYVVSLRNASGTTRELARRTTVSM